MSNPVSYTHLDVYKRQVLPVELRPMIVLDDVTSVSYTHLDVYKRQDYAYCIYVLQLRINAFLEKKC